MDETTIDDAENLDVVMPINNIVQIILKQQKVYGFILKMKQLILMLIFRAIILSFEYKANY